MNTEKIGYKIDSKLDESDTESAPESLKEEDREYPSDEELKNGYTFIQKTRKRKRERAAKEIVLTREDYDSE